jgi:hypothetical protein
MQRLSDEQIEALRPKRIDDELNDHMNRLCDMAKAAPRWDVPPRLIRAAQAFVKSYEDHLDRCRPCTINWQLLRDELSKLPEPPEG